MSSETQVWCRNLESGAVLKLAQGYQKQGQIAEALALCIKAAQVECPGSAHSNYRTLLVFATVPLREALGDDQYCQIFRAAFDDPVPREILTLMLDSLDQLRQRPEVIATWSSTEQFDPWSDATVALLPDPDPEFQQLSQAFLQSFHHKLAADLAPEQPPSYFDAYYSECFAHLNLPPGYTYLMPKPSSLSRVKRVEEQEEEHALREKNHYAFYRYLKTLGECTDPIYTVAFSPNGQTLASGSDDNGIKLWDSVTKHELRTLTGHADSVFSIAFSPDGQALASGSADNTVKLWDVQTGQELYTLTGHTHSVLSVTFSPDGQILASGSADNTVKLWDVQTGQELYTLIGHTHSVLSVTFSPDGQTLASGGADSEIKLWDVQTCQERYTLAQTSDCVYSLSFHPQGQMLVSSHQGQSIKVWDLNTHELSRTIPLYTEVVSVAVSPDGEAIAAGGGVLSRNVIWIWNFNTGKAISTFSRRDNSIYHRDLVYAIAFSSNSSMLASAGRDGTVKLWGIPQPLVF